MTANFRQLAARHRAAIPSHEIIRDPEAPNGGRLAVVTVRRVRAVTIVIACSLLTFSAFLWLTGVRLTTSATIRAATLARLTIENIDNLSDEAGLRWLREHDGAIKLFRDVMTVPIPEKQRSMLSQLLGREEYFLSAARRQIISELTIAAEEKTPQQRSELATSILVVGAAIPHDDFNATLQILADLPIQKRNFLFRNRAEKLKAFITHSARHDQVAVDLSTFEKELEEKTQTLESRIAQVERERARVALDITRTANVLDCVRRAAAALNRCPVRSPDPVRTR
jgi:hypothetical protein